MRNLLSRLFNKRKYQRRQIARHELILYDPNGPVEKKIVDLSTGGISFVYTDTGKPMPSVFDLDIQVDGGFHLGKVRAKTISDVLISEVTKDSKVLRRRTARFINISPVQEYELDKYLKNFGKNFSF